ncbi:MAG: HNH endonuclease family protein [Actinobacteria bacterium]|nr:HNH endonuclease family protein [Actinomycetota bacterium]
MRLPMRAYDRSAFGQDWFDSDGNGCNQRDDVLMRDAVPGTVELAVQGSCDHDVLAGTWNDPYTGAQLTFDDLKTPEQAMALQIDHVVPLAEAWRSGADAWSAGRRVAFANDLANLLAVDGEANQAKSDSGPEDWMPVDGFACEYVQAWVATKERYRLGVDKVERTALLTQFAECARGV